MELNLAKISNRHSSIVTRNSIKNLIFDFGGVIINIDVKLTEKAFMDLGIKKFDPGHSLSGSEGIFRDIETGALTSQQFRDELRKYFRNPVTDEQLDTAWNALLLDIPEPRIRLLEKLRKNYRIFLLSNTTEIHYMRYLGRLRNQFGYADFDALFEKAYLSYRIGLMKPSPEIFRHVLKDSLLDPSETFFIDDTLMHVEGARDAGIHACHLEIDKGEEITDLFQ
jgi:glucose-1-phosphatase